MSKFFDDLVASAEFAANAQNGHGEVMPSRSEIGGDELSEWLVKVLRERHAAANCYRMAEEIAAEGIAFTDFVREYGVLPAGDSGDIAEWLADVSAKVAERGRLEGDDALRNADILSTFLAETGADGSGGDDDDDGAGTGRGARLEEPHAWRGEER